MKTINILINFNYYIQCHLNRQAERLAYNYDKELDDIEIGDEYKENWNYIKELILTHFNDINLLNVKFHDVGFIEDVHVFLGHDIENAGIWGNVNIDEIKDEIIEILEYAENYVFDLPYFDEPDLFKNHCKRIQSNF